MLSKIMVGAIALSLSMIGGCFILQSSSVANAKWLVVEYYDAKSESVKYDVLNQNNQIVPLELPSNISQMLASKDQLLIISEKKIQVVTFPSLEITSYPIPLDLQKVTPDRLGKYFYAIGYLNDVCSVYRITLGSDNPESILNEQKNPDFYCDYKTTIAFGVDQESIWLVWGKGSSGYLTVYYQQYDLKSAKVLKDITLDEIFENGYLVSAEVTLTEDQEKRQLFDYKCQGNACGKKGEALVDAITQKAQKTIEEEVPWLTDNRDPLNRMKKNKCQAFDYERSRKPSELFYQSQPVAKYETSSIYQVMCLGVD